MMNSKFPAIVSLVALVSFVAEAATVEDGNTLRSLMTKSKIGILPKDVYRSYFAIRLSQVVEEGYKDDIDTVAKRYDFDPSNGIYLESGIDAVYLFREEGKYCAASFRGTTGHQIGDWITNVDLEPVAFGAVVLQQPDSSSVRNVTTSAPSLEECDVHSGYHEAYATFKFRNVVEEFLSTCRTECTECETILTGHSQGGGIAAIAALYMKFDSSGATKIGTNNSNDYDSPYVITFAAPQSLGAGCDPLISENERKKWFRYIIAREQELGDKLVYDPIPLLYAQLLNPPEEEDQSDSEDGFWDSFGGLFEFDIDTDDTYARKGGLAFIGHEIFLSTGDPSSILLSDFDGHRFVNLNNIDLTGKAHHDYIYAGVLEAQNEIYNGRNSTETCYQWEKDAHKAQILDAAKHNSTINCPEQYLPSTGFGAGSLCNPEESELWSTCAHGMVCEEEEKRWFWEGSRHTCQPLQVIGKELETLPPTQLRTAEPSNDGTVAENDEEALDIMMLQEEPVAILSTISSGVSQTQIPSLLLSSWVNGAIAVIAIGSAINF